MRSSTCALNSTAAGVVLILILDRALQDLYNFLLDRAMDPVAPSSASNLQLTRYSEYLASKAMTSGSNNTVEGVLNGAVKEKLKIIPKDHQ